MVQLEWVKDTGGESNTNQHDLLGRVSYGQKQLVDQTECGFWDYAYFVDFENKVLEVEGVLENTLIIAFEDLEVGVIDEMGGLSEEEEEGEEQKKGEMN